MKNKAVSKIREFNRFYTSVIGVTNNHILESDFSLTEVRTMYEVYHRDKITARQIMEMIRVDEGYLSRSIKRLEKKGIIKKLSNDLDKRISFLKLTEKGERIFLALNQKSTEAITALTRHLSAKEQDELTVLLERIQKLLTKSNTEDGAK